MHRKSRRRLYFQSLQAGQRARQGGAVALQLGIKLAFGHGQFAQALFNALALNIYVANVTRQFNHPKPQALALVLNGLCFFFKPETARLPVANFVINGVEIRLGVLSQNRQGQQNCAQHQAAQHA